MKLGVIGTGLAFWDLHVPVLAGLTDRVELVAVSSSSQRSAEQAVARLADAGLTSRAADIENLLSDPSIDAVLVAVPIARTAELVRRALEAGKHVLAEKPLATSGEEARELLELADSGDVALLAGENFRLQPDFARTRDLVASGAIGQPRLYFLNDLHYTPPTGKYAQTSWRIEGEHRGGYLLDGGTHIIAGMRELVGSEIVSVHAVGSAVQSYLSAQMDTLLINMTFENGLVGHVALGYGVHDPESRHPKIYGDRATIAIMPQGIVRIDGEGQTILAERSGVSGFELEWDTFISALESAEGREEARRLTVESIKDLQLLEAALESAACGTSVRLS